MARFSKPRPLPVDATDALLDTAATAALLSVPEGTVQKWRALRRGPDYIRVGNAARYRRADLLAWLDRNVVRCDSAEAETA